MQLKQSLSMYRKYNYVTPPPLYIYLTYILWTPFFLTKKYVTPLILPPHLHPLRTSP